jgi:enamine deaminase RidA (YjgF/YER057c/UK114 family)
MSALQILLPPGWPRPRGYANGMVGQGRIVFIGGQIGWDETGRFAEGLVAQVEQVLRNIVAVLAEAGGAPTDIARLTWYVVDAEDYSRSLREVGEAYLRVLGRHYPTMAVVQVVRLVEAAALVEIEATALV